MRSPCWRASSTARSVAVRLGSEMRVMEPKWKTLAEAMYDPRVWARQRGETIYIDGGWEDSLL